jgi:hypothetical protein
MKRSLLTASFVFLLAAAACVATEIAPYQVSVRPTTHFNLGLGVGPMYGEGGANIEYFATPQLSATAGVGLHRDPGWFAGGRFYMKPAGHGPRARITAGVAQMSNQFLGTSVGSGKAKALLAVGGSWANADTDYRGFDFDLSTAGTLSVGYHF